MRSLAAAALALLAGGCLEADVNRCDNGAICPDGFACTEQGSLCGPTLRVNACEGHAELAGCDYRELPGDATAAGVCHAGICDPCSPDLAGCSYPGWTQMTSGTNEDLLAIAAASDTDVDAVGAHGTYVHYDGTAWSRSSALSDVSGTSAALLAIWRGGGVKLALSSNGELFRTAEASDGWQKVAALPAGSAVTAMSAASATDVIVVGLAGLLYHFDGAALSPITPAPITSFPYKGVWCDASGDVWAVGVQGGVVRRSAGTWSVARAPMSTQSTLNAAWERSASDVWFVGDFKNAQPTVAHFDGGSAPSELVLPAAIGTLSLLGVTGSATDVWATGDEGTIVHGDGTTWDAQATGANAALYAIGGTHDLFAVGKGGRILRLTP